MAAHTEGWKSGLCGSCLIQLADWWRNKARKMERRFQHPSATSLSEWAFPIEIVPKKAAGTAAGFTGFFGYVFGSAFAGTGVGWLVDHFDWSGVIFTMCLCAVLTIVFAAFTLGHKREPHTTREA